MTPPPQAKTHCATETTASLFSRPLGGLGEGQGVPRFYSRTAVTFTSVKCLSAIRGDNLDLLHLFICQATRLDLVPPRARPGLMSGMPWLSLP